jgi:DinB superfamily
MFPPELEAEAKKKLKYLEELTAQLFGELEGLTVKQIEFKPASKEWNIKEVVCHLRDVDLIFRERADKMLDEDEPFLRGFNPEELAEESGYVRAIWDEVLGDFQNRRTQNLIFFRELRITQWLKRAIHQERGSISMLEVIESLISQSEMHLEQIRNNKKLAI